MTTLINTRIVVLQSIEAGELEEIKAKVAEAVVEEHKIHKEAMLLTRMVS